MTQDVKFINFDDALAEAGGKRHLLLGNGFSIACKSDIFSYKALFDLADFQKVSEQARKTFDEFSTHDFELIIQKLKDSAKVLKVYSEGESKQIEIIQKDAELLKDILIKTITERHPRCPNEIEEYQYLACRKFLNHFENIYTLNYDLLLYWALLYEKDNLKLICDDGFRKPPDKNTEYVSWDMNADRQNIFYLHGALHIYDAVVEAEVRKYTWINTGIKLLDQIRSALASGMFPLFVAEGIWKKKLVKINHSNFLGRALRSFSHVGGNLFVFGHSFTEKDKHILQAIEKGKIKKIYISIYGDINSMDNQKLINRALRMQDNRIDYRRKVPLEVVFYKAEQVNVWGDNN